MIRHYPTPTTVSYYVGEYLIDDAYRIDFNRKRTDQPIWGYGSTHFDFIARGREIVTGNIVLNFRYPGYLTNVIRSQQGKTPEDIGEENAEKLLSQFDASNSIETKMATVADFLTNWAYLKSRKNQKDAYEKLKFVESDDSYEKFPEELRLRDITYRLGDLTYNSDIRPTIESVKSLLEKRNFLRSTERDEDSSVYKYKSPLDDIRGAAPFDLTVRYGFQNIPGGFSRVFRDVILIGESEVVQAAPGNDMASSAQALLEIYPFFCRTISVEEWK